MAILNALASLAVGEMNSAVRWHERLLGRPADANPMRTLAEWEFDGGGRLQIYELPARAGAGSVTLAVSDIDEQVAALDALGIDTDARSTSERVKTVMITDPDGNHIAFAEG